MTGALPEVEIFTDGGCHGNPGPGAWAAILVFGRHRKELVGGDPATTNNRMELQAAISGLSALTTPCKVIIHTDSQYLRQGITQWIHQWKRNHWLTSKKQPVKNADLWKDLDAVRSRHTVEWMWLKGHAGHLENERCDQLAAGEIGRIRQSHSPEALRLALPARELAKGEVPTY